MDFWRTRVRWLQRGQRGWSAEKDQCAPWWEEAALRTMALYRHPPLGWFMVCFCFYTSSADKPSARQRKVLFAREAFTSHCVSEGLPSWFSVQNPWSYVIAQIQKPLLKSYCFRFLVLFRWPFKILKSCSCRKIREWRKLQANHDVPPPCLGNKYSCVKPRK